jgi:hypothetical protein
MRSTVAAQSEWPIIAGFALIALPVGIVLAVFVAIALKLLAPGIDLSSLAEHTTQSLVLALAMMGIGLACAVPTVLWALVALVAGMMLVHRLAWPLASRLLYALGPRYRLVQNKVALNAAGVMLAGVAITGNYGWQAILRHFGVA